MHGYPGSFAEKKQYTSTHLHDAAHRLLELRVRHCPRCYPGRATYVLSPQVTDEEVEEACRGHYVCHRKLVSIPCHFNNNTFMLILLSGCITTIVRLRSLLTFKISVDPTWDYVPVVIWTELEITAAFACVSLPAIRVLLVKITPKSLKGWLSEVTQASSNLTPRVMVPKESSSRRNWHKNDMWINLSSTEGSGEKQMKDRIGLLPSAETSTSHLKTVETRSTTGLSDNSCPTVQPSEAVAALDLPLPKKPVSVKSRFSN